MSTLEERNTPTKCKGAVKPQSVSSELNSSCKECPSEASLPYFQVWCMQVGRGGCGAVIWIMGEQADWLWIKEARDRSPARPYIACPPKYLSQCLPSTSSHDPHRRVATEAVDPG